MKQVLYYISALVAVIAVSVSCSEVDHTYKGDNFVQFSDTTSVYPVKENTADFFEVVLGATRSTSYDRVVTVEILPAQSNAIEGLHYELLDHNALIKAGELTTVVRIKASYEELSNPEMSPYEELYVTLRLASINDNTTEIYGDETKVYLRKSCTFSVDNLLEDGGNFIIYDPFIAGEYIQRLCTAEKIDDTRVVFRNAFYTATYQAEDGIYIPESYTDFIVNFDIDSDPFFPTVKVFPQYYTNLGEVNDLGQLYVHTIPAMDAYIYPCSKLIYLGMEMYLEGYQGNGSMIFDRNIFLLQWVSQKEADAFTSSQQ